MNERKRLDLCDQRAILGSVLADDSMARAPVTGSRRTGQDHHRARLTARDIELIFELREQGWPLGRIARKMECSTTHVYYVLKGLRRVYG